MLIALMTQLLMPIFLVALFYPVIMNSLKTACSKLVLKSANSFGLRSLTLSNGLGHDSTSRNNAQSISIADQELIAKFDQNQKYVKRLTYAEESRTLLDTSLHFGVLSTNDVDNGGFPTGSVVGFQLDHAGLPFFVFSTLAGHTKNILKDERCSLTVMANNFKGAAQGRVSIGGKVKKVTNKTVTLSLREQYLKYHKDAYWVDFGDFSFYRMYTIESIRYVGGFALVGNIDISEFLAAKPDPLASFAAEVLVHMNVAHPDSICAMVCHYGGIPCTKAEMVSVDRYGFTVNASLKIGNGFSRKVRLNFPTVVLQREQLRETMYGMVKAARRE